MKCQTKSKCSRKCRNLHNRCVTCSNQIEVIIIFCNKQTYSKKQHNFLLSWSNKHILTISFVLITYKKSLFNYFIIHKPYDKQKHTIMHPFCWNELMHLNIHSRICCIFINIPAQSASYVRTEQQKAKKSKRTVYDCKRTVTILIENQQK